MLYNCALDDATVLSGLPRLMAVDITRCRLTDAAMFYDLPGLKHLTVESSTITYTGQYVPKNEVSSLEWVYFYATDGEMSLPHVSMLKNAELLGFVYCDIFSLNPLAELTGIKDLILWGNSIQSLEPLRGFKSLEYLSVSDNLIKDITPLLGLDSLGYLDLEGNGLPEKEYIRLKDALPGCEIFWN
jgi:hypothetical protein